MWITIPPNTAVNMVCLVEAADILACDQCAIWLDEGNSPVWVYTGPDDPSHDLNIDRRYRAYLPVLAINEETGEREPRVFSMGKSVHMALLDIADAVGEIAGVELRIKRTGAKLSTRYTVAQTGKRFEVDDVPEVDVISLLGPITPEGVRDLLCTKLGKGSYEEVVAAYRGKSTSRKHTAKASGSGPVGKKVSRTKVEEETEDEEEDLEDVELL
jgi:hypothetical protein